MDCGVSSAASLARSQFVPQKSRCYACSLNCAISSTDSLLCRIRSVIDVNLCKGAVPMSLGTNEARANSERKPQNTRVGGANYAPRVFVECEVSKW